MTIRKWADNQGGANMQYVVERIRMTLLGTHLDGGPLQRRSAMFMADSMEVAALPATRLLPHA